MKKVGLYFYRPSLCLEVNLLKQEDNPRMQVQEMNALKVRLFDYLSTQLQWYSIVNNEIFEQ